MPREAPGGLGSVAINGLSRCFFGFAATKEPRKFFGPAGAFGARKNEDGIDSKGVEWQASTKV